MAIKHYYKWDQEDFGYPTRKGWGNSICYCETFEDMYPRRLVEIFANGRTLKYDEDYLDDKFGRLPDAGFDMEEIEDYRIDVAEFEKVWETTEYKKFPEIVCTSDTLWGQPRFDGTKLAVGDIVSLMNTYSFDMREGFRHLQLNSIEVRQALQYCRDLVCKADNPERFCHNCLLRVEQDIGKLDEEDPEQANWLIAERLLKQHFVVNIKGY